MALLEAASVARAVIMAIKHVVKVATDCLLFFIAVRMLYGYILDIPIRNMLTAFRTILRQSKQTLQHLFSPFVLHVCYGFVFTEALDSLILE